MCDTARVVNPAREQASKSPTSPGVGGYVLAVGVSLITLALEISVVDAVQQGTAHDVVDVVVAVVLFGAVPAAVNRLGRCRDRPLRDARGVVSMACSRTRCGPRTGGWADRMVG